MEINKYSSAISSYKANSYEKNKVEKTQKSATLKNVDKIEFSASKQNSIQGLKSSIAQKVEGKANPERINSLQCLINNNGYNIPAEAIAKSILG